MAGDGGGTVQGALASVGAQGGGSSGELQQLPQLRFPWKLQRRSFVAVARVVVACGSTAVVVLVVRATVLGRDGRVGVGEDLLRLGLVHLLRLLLLLQEQHLLQHVETVFPCTARRRSSLPPKNHNTMHISHITALQHWNQSMSCRS